MKTIQKMMSLKGRCALITGANGGIGRQMAITIAELGGDLVLVDMPGRNYDDLLTVIDGFGVNATCIDCDLEDENSRKELISNIYEDPNPLNILINNAAFVSTTNLKGWLTDLEGQSLDAWRRCMEVNLAAVFDLSKGLARKIKLSGHGSIINIASIYGVSGPDYSLYDDTDMGNPAAYAVSKGGLIQLTRWLSTTLAPDIRVNSLSPGGVFRDQPNEFVQRYKAKTPLGRMAVEEDFKGTVTFLASDLSEYVTGQNILVDGGWTVW
tara:strand:+ start:647 stop:1447 length:801 start_codon:yes stop_codon:yes gene_type:complete